MTHEEIRAWLSTCDPTLPAHDAKDDDIPPGWEALLKRACLAYHDDEWARRPEWADRSKNDRE